MHLASLRRFFPTTLRGILVLQALLVLVPVLLVQTGIYYNWFLVRRQIALEANLEVARAVAMAFDEYLHDIRRQEFAIGEALTPEIPPFEVSTQNATHMLVRTAAQYPAIVALSWLTPDGKVMASSNPLAVGTVARDQPYSRELLSGREWVVADLERTRRASGEVFSVAQVIRDLQGGFRGVVVAELAADRLDEEIKVKRTAGGAFAIIDHSGWLVYRYPEGKVPWNQRDWGHTYTVVEQALAGQEAAGVAVMEYDKLKHIVAAVPISSIGWAAGASLPEAQITAPIIRGMIRDSILLLIVAALAFTLAALTARRIIAAMAPLHEHALAIEQGQLDHRISLAGISELEELADAFNHMADEVQARQGEHERLLELERARARVARLLETIQENVDIYLIYLDKDLRILQANPVFCRGLGVSCELLSGRSFTDYVADPGVQTILQQALSAGETMRFHEMPYESPHHPQDGATYWDWAVTPVKDEQGDVEGLVISAVEVTEQVQERNARLEAERARAQLAEAMAAEVSHRIKNKLALVAGILQLQLTDMPPDSPAADAISQTIGRLQALSVAHEHLAEQHEDKVEMVQAVRRIIEINCQALARDEVEIAVAGSRVYLPPDKAGTLLIIINELVTNAIKHGAPEADGKLRIKADLAQENGRLNLSLWNSGPPVPADFDIAAQQGLGLRLAYEVTAYQLGGSLTLRPHQGGTLSELIINDSENRTN